MNIALILAAGKGIRFDQQSPKQLYKINGKTIIEYSLDVVEGLEAIDWTMVVIHPPRQKDFKEIIRRYNKRVEICKGGSTRQESVYNGLTRIKETISGTEGVKVLIHDSARPFSRDVFSRVIE